MSGSVTGHFDDPRKGPKYVCGTPTFPDLFALNGVEGDVNSVRYSLGISINNFTGAGKQTGNVVITVGKTGDGGSQPFLNVTGFPTVVMTDKQSGSFEADLRQGFDQSAPTLHIKGTFRC